MLGSVAPTPPTFDPPKLTPIAPVLDPMASIAMSPAPAADIPDWLKNTTDRLTNTPDPLTNVVPPVVNVPVATPVVEAPTVAALPVEEIPPVEINAPTATSEAALPDWLVGSNVTEASPMESTPSMEAQEETYTETFDVPASEGPTSDTAEVMTDASGEESMEVPANSEYLPVTEVSHSTPESEIAVTPEIASVPDEVPAPTVEESPRALETVVASEPTPVADELPDWLKNFAPTPSVPAQSQPIAKEEDDIFGDALIEKQFGFPASDTESATTTPSDSGAPSVPKAPKPKKQKTSTPMPEIKPTASTDDLPDWLK